MGIHAARRLTSIEFSFNPCNIYRDGPRGIGYTQLTHVQLAIAILLVGFGSETVTALHYTTLQASAKHYMLNMPHWLHLAFCTIVYQMLPDTYRTKAVFIQLSTTTTTTTTTTTSAKLVYYLCLATQVVQSPFLITIMFWSGIF